MDGGPEVPPRVWTEPLEIHTLGSFMVKRGDRVLSEEADRSNKMWELFKVMVTFRGRLLTPQFLVEVLWPEQEPGEKRLALKALVHRLRRVIEGPGPGVSRQKGSYVLFTHGCYTWNLQAPYQLDAQRFEELYLLARQRKRDAPDEAADLYGEALGVYKGEYLPECSREWVEASRTRLRRLYIQAVLEVGDLLMRSGAADRLVGICERALELEPLEEELHALYIKVLLEQGKTGHARLHYQEATAAIYRKFGLSPSPVMRELYRLIGLWSGDGKRRLYPAPAARSDTGEEEPRAYGSRAHPGVRRSEKRERTADSPWLLVLSLTPRHTGANTESLTDVAAKVLGGILAANVRRTDVVWRWSRTEFMVLLRDADTSQARRVGERVVSAFRTHAAAEAVYLGLRVLPLKALQEMDS